MTARARWAELRTAVTGVDPGLIRLRLAGIAVAAMLLAVGVTSVVRTVSGQPITVVLISAVLAMISNLAVNEPGPHRVRVTTAVMMLPAVAAVSAGTLLAPHRVVADVVFVAIMAVAVAIRRYGPRGNALGMAAVMGYFFTQFLQATVEQLPWLLLAAVTGIASTLLLRGFVLAENTDRTLHRFERAFRAHVHGLLDAVADLLESDPDGREHAQQIVARRRTRLNETALLIADHLERDRSPDDGEDGAPGRDELHILDAELSAERLAVATRRLVQEGPPGEEARRSLLAGLHSLGAATATGAAAGLVPVLLDGARRSVAALVADTEGLGDRTQRVAFAITRLADALATDPDAADLERPEPAPAAPRFGVAPAPGHADRTAATRGSTDGPAPTRPSGDGAPLTAGAGAVLLPSGDGDTEPTPDRAVGAAPTAGGGVTTPAIPDGADDDAADRGRLHPSTRQAVQVAFATAGAIVVGELISPSRWYWAVIAAFVVFAGTTSRGDVLSRGSQRVVGTIGGVAAGMALAVVVSGTALPALILLFLCVFLALYLVRVSQALMAFWITAVLALLYGLIGQFSVETLFLRIEETAAGAAMGMLAGYLILPTGTRTAFGTALDDLVGTVHDVLDAVGARLAGEAVPEPPVELARAMDTALSVLRARAKPLDNPLPRRRGRSSYQRALRVFTAVDHYARRLARLSDGVRDPSWAATLRPALAEVSINIDGLAALLRHRDGPAVASAEDAVDAAEAHAARIPDHRLRGELLMAARLVRRIDQAVVGFATDLTAPARPRATTVGAAPGRTG